MAGAAIEEVQRVLEGLVRPATPADCAAIALVAQAT